MSKQVIASTLGMDVADLDGYRYQPTRTTRAIYAIGDCYFAVGKTSPTDDVGGVWNRHPDQFWAARKGTVLWIAKAE